MKPARRQFLHLTASAAVLPVLPHAARGQAYPTRPVHILVGLAAGGPTDTAARVMAEWFSQQFKQQFIVENRTGMGGNLANQAVFSSLPDGHTLLFTGPNTTISTALYKKLPYNLFQDSTAVGSMMRFPNIMVVPPNLPIKTVKELIDYAKARPGELSLASSGVGASPHLSGELFKFMTNIDMVHVPYRGSSAVYPDLISGKVHMLFDNLSGPVLQLIQSGQLRALGVTSASRWESLPDMPAIAETVPGYEVTIWYGMFAPRSTSPEIVEALNRSINAALGNPQVLARIVEGGGRPMPMTIAEFGKFVRDDVEKWRKVVEFAKISAD